VKDFFYTQNRAIGAFSPESSLIRYFVWEICLLKNLSSTANRRPLGTSASGVTRNRILLQMTRATVKNVNANGSLNTSDCRLNPLEERLVGEKLLQASRLKSRLQL
jgi:hypothetical protein